MRVAFAIQLDPMAIVSGTLLAMKPVCRGSLPLHVLQRLRQTDQTDFPSSFNRIFSIARDGSNPFGQTSEQFMMVRQRKAVGIVQLGQPFVGGLIAAVGDESVRLQQTCRADEALSNGTA